jgi:predicted DsbA family dithiol-disulfide isomerase
MKEVASQPLVPGNVLGFTLVRVPFFLEPDYPEEEEFGETNRQRLIRKWGGVEAWEEQKKRHGLKERGLAVGIEHFNLDRIASSTLKSHRLVQWATKTAGINVAEALYDELNFRHFQAGQKLNSSTMLCDAAEKVGLDRRSADDFLCSSAGLAEIRAAQTILHRIGVNSIPSFVLGGKVLISGALPQPELVRHLREAELLGGAPGALFAEALAIPRHVMFQTLDLDRPTPAGLDSAAAAVPPCASHAAAGPGGLDAAPQAPSEMAR